jgi:hypothetical protein
LSPAAPARGAHFRPPAPDRQLQPAFAPPPQARLATASLFNKACGKPLSPDSNEFQAPASLSTPIFAPEYRINPKALLFVIFFTNGSTKIHKI